MAWRRVLKAPQRHHDGWCDCEGEQEVSLFVIFAHYEHEHEYGACASFLPAAQELLSAATQTSRIGKQSSKAALERSSTSHTTTPGSVEHRSPSPSPSASQHQRADCEQPAVIAPSTASSYGEPALRCFTHKAAVSKCGGIVNSSLHQSRARSSALQHHVQRPCTDSPSTQHPPIALHFG
jgi:hypothetical protein